MKTKKEGKSKGEKNSVEETFGEVTTKAELKSFLLNIRDKMTDEQAAPLYAMSAINYALNLPDIYSMMDNENKELARDIWLRIRQAGLQVRSPAMLFSEDENGAAPTNA